MAEDIKQSDTKAPFNMALNTLERLGEILTKIREVSADPFMPLNIKQTTKVQLVRQFFQQASPLLTEAVVSANETRFFALRPKSQQIIETQSSGMRKVTERMHDTFDWDLEDKLEKFLLDIQRELQKERYFMPPKKDKGRAAAEF